MTLPSSGPISIEMIAAELGISPSGLSLNDSRVRQLAGRPSGQISFSDFYGKSRLLPPVVGQLRIGSRAWETQGGYYPLGGSTCHSGVNVTNSGGAASSISVSFSGAGRADSVSGLTFRVCGENRQSNSRSGTLTVTLYNAAGQHTKSFPMSVYGSWGGN